jgi:pyrimidine operon attenuation protein/uracil phosphoribosyltransferase
VIWNADKISDAVVSVRNSLIEGYREYQKEFPETPLALIGIRTGGAHLAQRLKQPIEAALKQPVSLGILDITLYRDDMLTGNARHIPLLKGTHIPFDLEGAYVVLVDDVLFTGRTIRSALDALTDLGRPASIRLAILVDRGHRELPIQSDHCGGELSTGRTQSIKLHLTEEGHDEDVLWSIQEGAAR